MALRKIATALAMLAAAGLLALALQGSVAAPLAEPLVRLWWLIDALPQRLVWSALALIGFLLVYFLGHGPRQNRPKLGTKPPPRRSPPQIERLAQLIQLGETSLWAREVLALRLRERAADLRALREGLTLEEARTGIESGRWLADPRLARVLRPEMKEGEGQASRYSYTAELAHALEALERYMEAKDGASESN